MTRVGTYYKREAEKGLGRQNHAQTGDYGASTVSLLQGSLACVYGRVPWACIVYFAILHPKLSITKPEKLSPSIVALN